MINYFNRAFMQLYTVFQKNWTFVTASYLCSDSYELHENFRRTYEVLLVVNME